LRQAACSEELIHRTLQRILLEAARFPLDRTPPEMGRIIHRIVREESGNRDPYAAIKSESTRNALQLMGNVRRVITGSARPFEMAVRFSIAGNIMDYALLSKWSPLELDSLTEKTRRESLDTASVEKLHTAARRARSILVIGDNAGETVFDRLLIEQMEGAAIYYAVKGSPVINDATLHDARAAGLDRVAELVENGNDAPGTLLEDCSESFRRIFDEAELVIAKGQANYETLSQAARPVFFLTQVKCPVIGRDLGEPVGRWVVKEHMGDRK
jgi:uncharacterized protein with ATP-grasp and redox domains